MKHNAGGGTRTGFLTRTLVASAMVGFYCLSILGVSGLLTVASVSSAQARGGGRGGGGGRGRGDGRGRGAFRGRGGGWGPGIGIYGYGYNDCYWGPRGRWICPY
jgi:hypothetical protein